MGDGHWSNASEFGTFLTGVLKAHKAVFDRYVSEHPDNFGIAVATTGNTTIDVTAGFLAPLQLGTGVGQASVDGSWSEGVFQDGVRLAAALPFAGAAARSIAPALVAESGTAAALEQTGQAVQQTAPVITAETAKVYLREIVDDVRAATITRTAADGTSQSTGIVGGCVPIAAAFAARLTGTNVYASASDFLPSLSTESLAGLQSNVGMRLGEAVDVLNEMGASVGTPVKLPTSAAELQELVEGFGPSTVTMFSLKASGATTTKILDQVEEIQQALVDRFGQDPVALESATQSINQFAQFALQNSERAVSDWLPELEQSVQQLEVGSGGRAVLEDAIEWVKQQGTGHLMSAFIDESGNYWLADENGFYTALEEVGQTLGPDFGHALLSDTVAVVQNATVLGQEALASVPQTLEAIAARDLPAEIGDALQQIAPFLATIGLGAETLLRNDEEGSTLTDLAALAGDDASSLLQQIGWPQPDAPDQRQPGDEAGDQPGSPGAIGQPELAASAVGEAESPHFLQGSLVYEERSDTAPGGGDDSPLDQRQTSDDGRVGPVAPPDDVPQPPAEAAAEASSTGSAEPALVAEPTASESARTEPENDPKPLTTIHGPLDEAPVTTPTTDGTPTAPPAVSEDQAPPSPEQTNPAAAGPVKAQDSGTTPAAATDTPPAKPAGSEPPSEKVNPPINEPAAPADPGTGFAPGPGFVDDQGNTFGAAAPSAGQPTADPTNPAPAVTATPADPGIGTGPGFVDDQGNTFGAAAPSAAQPTADPTNAAPAAPAQDPGTTSAAAADTPPAQSDASSPLSTRDTLAANDPSVAAAMESGTGPGFVDDQGNTFGAAPSATQPIGDPSNPVRTDPVLGPGTTSAAAADTPRAQPDASSPLSTGDTLAANDPSVAADLGPGPGPGFADDQGNTFGAAPSAGSASESSTDNPSDQPTALPAPGYEVNPVLAVNPNTTAADGAPAASSAQLTGISELGPADSAPPATATLMPQAGPGADPPAGAGGGADDNPTLPAATVAALATAAPQEDPAAFPPAPSADAESGSGSAAPTAVGAAFVDDQGNAFGVAVPSQPGNAPAAVGPPGAPDTSPPPTAGAQAAVSPSTDSASQTPAQSPPETVVSGRLLPAAAPGSTDNPPDLAAGLASTEADAASIQSVGAYAAGAAVSQAPVPVTNDTVSGATSPLSFGVQAGPIDTSGWTTAESSEATLSVNTWQASESQIAGSSGYVSTAAAQVPDILPEAPTAAPEGPTGAGFVDDQGSAFGALAPAQSSDQPQAANVDPGAISPAIEAPGATPVDQGNVPTAPEPEPAGSPLADSTDGNTEPARPVDENVTTASDAAAQPADSSQENATDRGDQPTPGSDSAGGSQIHIDPVSGQPYEVDSETGDAASIQSVGTDAYGNLLYQAPTPAGGGEFVVAAGGSVSFAEQAGPIDTSGWSTASTDETSGAANTWEASGTEAASTSGYDNPASDSTAQTETSGGSGGDSGGNTGDSAPASGSSTTSSPGDSTGDTTGNSGDTTTDTSGGTTDTSGGTTDNSGGTTTDSSGGTTDNSGGTTDSSGGTGDGGTSSTGFSSGEGTGVSEGSAPEPPPVTTSGGGE